MRARASDARTTARGASRFARGAPSRGVGGAIGTRVGRRKREDKKMRARNDDDDDDGTAATTERASRAKAPRSGAMDAAEDATGTAAARRAFWETFWRVLEENRGKAPFARRRAVDDGETRSRARDGKSESVEAWPVPVRSDTFWGRCTIGGLCLAIGFAYSACALTHWPTVRYVAANPLVFAFNPFGVDAEANATLVIEIFRRLVKPGLRFVASWCALRSNWRWMWGTLGASMLFPAVL